MDDAIVLRARIAVLCGVLASCHSSSEATTAPPGLEAGADTGAAASERPAVNLPNALGLPAASVRAVVNPMNLPAYDGPTGTVEGTVFVQGPDAPDVPNLDVRACPAALDTYGKLFRAGPRRADGLRPLADAIVVMTGYSGFYLPEKNEVERATIGPSCGYAKRSVALTFGQRLEIANDSAIPFAPYLEGVPRLTVMIAPPRQAGEPVKIFPHRVDYFPLRDQLQSYVRGDVYVLRQPLHAITDTQGYFRIEGAPVGKLTIGARLADLLGEATKDVDVRANVVQKVDLVLVYAPSDGGGGSTRRPREGLRPAQ
jgi:hypothetical protein